MIGMELMLPSLFFCPREFSCESVRERNLTGDEEDRCVSRYTFVCVDLFFPRNLKLKWEMIYDARWYQVQDINILCSMYPLIL